MAVEFVGGAQSTGSTVAITAHQPGDLILAWAFRSGSNSPPVVPSGQNWGTPIFLSDRSSANNSAGAVLVCKIAASSSEGFGTFTSATQCEVAVYRGTDQSSPIGAIATTTAISAAVNYPALTATASGSFIAAVAAHRTSTIVNTPPAGMVNRVNRGSGTAALAIHDTDGPASSFASDTETGSNSSGWRSIVFEIKVAAKTFVVGATPLLSKYVGAAKSARYVGRSLEWESS